MQSITSTKLAHYGILSLLLMGLFVVIAIVNQALQDSYRQRVFSDTEKQLQTYYNQLNTTLQSHIQTVRGLPGLFAVNPQLSQRQFENGVKHLIGHGSEFRNIAAAPDMVIRYMYPMAGNEQAIGLDFRKAPEQFETADRARRTREMVLAGPLELAQGGSGLIIRIPVFVDDDSGGEYFWGLISAVIDVERFFKKSGLIAENLPIKIAIRGKDSLGRQGDMILGEPALFETPRLTQTLKLPEGEWVLAAEPLEGWDKSSKEVWQKKLMFDAIALILFFMIVMFMRVIFKSSLANHKFRNLIESAPVPYLLLNRHNHVIYVNRAFSETYGYSINDMVDMRNWWDITDQPVKYQQLFEAQESDTSKLESGKEQPIPIEIKIICQNKQNKVALLSASSLSDTLENEKLVLVYDITVRKEAEEQLRFSSRVFNQAQEGIIITSRDGVITDVNPAFCEITGYSREEVVGRRPNFLKSGKHSPAFYAKLWQSVLEHGYWQGEVWNRRKNGELYAELLTISALTDDEGESHHFVGLFSDITQSKQQQETLELMAHYDVLTKLPNRVLFADRFTQAAAHSRRTNTLLAVCFLDLDSFKPVNDNYGHEIGDQLLVEVAARLKANVRDEDTISRFGGDEFAILFRDVESESQCSDMLQRIHRSLANPYHLNENIIEISASSGVTFYPSDDADLDTLLRHADQTMYEAKLAGRNTFKLFNPNLNTQIMERQQWLDQMRQAIDEGQLRLFFQPKVNMRTGKVFGMEALIRWQHPERGLMAPGQFLPDIEGTVLEFEVGKWVIEQALWQLESWHVAGFNIEVSVNVSSNYLQSHSFIDDVNDALAEHMDIHSRYLQLEILESSALGDIAAISKIIKLARDLLGVSVALDDFGTGYSSLTHLRHLTASTIKIDQSFVRDMLDDPQDFTIVDGVTGLADSFNRQVIAEGVETNEHGLLLLMIGCESAQGYGIARPMPDDEVISWLKHYQPSQQWMKTAAEPLSPRQRALVIFNLTSIRWYQAFLDSVMSEPDKVQHWPIMSHKKCHGGSWIIRVSTQGLFNPVWLANLQQRHEAFHVLAYEIRERYLSESPEAARKSLPELDRLFNEMQQLFEQTELPEAC